MPKLQLNGSPGEVYTNTGDRILYQFHCQFGHSCGVCISYHMAIGTSFPIPLHRGCNCTQTPIFPGQSGEPFVDFREMIRELPPAEQAAVMGRSNLQLVESGVVKYEDVVTRTRVRDLREVVSRGKLSVEEMVDAGVGRRQAERAYETVHTPAHELADAKRRDLIEALRGKGIADDAIRRAVSERIALRIGIGAGPSGPDGLFITPITPAPPAPPGPATPIDRAVAYGELHGIRVIRDGHDRIVEQLGEEAGRTTMAYWDNSIIPPQIYLNERHRLWSDPEEVMAEFREERWLSTSAVDHTIRHEVAHELHARDVGPERRREIKEMPWTFDEKTIAVGVSRYAMKSPVEFVAEVYAGLVAGRKYNEPILKLYDRLGGPRP